MLYTFPNVLTKTHASFRKQVIQDTCSIGRHVVSVGEQGWDFYYFTNSTVEGSYWRRCLAPEVTSS